MTDPAPPSSRSSHISWWRSVRVWITVTVSVLILAIVTSSAITLYEHGRLDDARNNLVHRLRPAQRSADLLETAYVDQETGQRGYLLTGDPLFLQPYIHGVTQTDRMLHDLETRLAGREHVLALLGRVRAAAGSWRMSAGDPEIAARRKGPIPAAQIDQFADLGKVLFDELRARLAALSSSIRNLTEAELNRFNRAQDEADVASIVAVGLAVLGALLTGLLLHRFWTRPLGRLIGQVQAVSAGAYDQHIDVGGPQEIATLARAVEDMRSTIVRSSEGLVDATHELSTRAERDRLAADLHDLTIQRVFALGLSLESLAVREPTLKANLAPVVDETDEIIRELRGVIFALSHDRSAADPREQVIALARDSSRALGFAPTVEFSGPLESVDPARVQQMLTVAREALSNVARHADATSVNVTVTVTDDALSLAVVDDGVGTSSGGVVGNGLRNIRERARQLDGNVLIAPAYERVKSPGTAITWRVPLT